MEVVTKWPGLIDPIKRAGHTPVFSTTRCGSGYCLAGGECEKQIEGATCEHFTKTEPKP